MLAIRLFKEITKMFESSRPFSPTRPDSPARADSPPTLGRNRTNYLDDEASLAHLDNTSLFNKRSDQKLTKPDLKRMQKWHEDSDDESEPPRAKKQKLTDQKLHDATQRLLLKLNNI